MKGKRKLERLDKDEKRKKELKLESYLMDGNDKATTSENVDDSDSNKPLVSEIHSSKLESSGRSWTLSIALPGSILENAQSPPLRAYLASQVGRAAAIFAVDEIVIFDEKAMMKDSDAQDRDNINVRMCRLLQYLECPQYLRKRLFLLSTELKFAGTMNPLDAPHHLRSTDLSLPYREGVVINKPAKKGKGSLVDAGLAKDVQIDRLLQPDVRVTLKFDDIEEEMQRKKPKAKVVSPMAPRQDSGLYWGYNVRLSLSLSQVFSEAPFSGGYDLVIGTSDKGSPIGQVAIDKGFKHAVIVFGGLPGIEACLEADESLTMNEPTQLFDYYLNTCPGQGSRTIRTEEAILISLGVLKAELQKCSNKV